MSCRLIDDFTMQEDLQIADSSILLPTTISPHSPMFCFSLVFFACLGLLKLWAPHSGWVSLWLFYVHHMCMRFVSAPCLCCFFAPLASPFLFHIDWGRLMMRVPRDNKRRGELKMRPASSDRKKVEELRDVRVATSKSKKFISEAGATLQKHMDIRPKHAGRLQDALWWCASNVADLPWGSLSLFLSISLLSWTRDMMGPGYRGSLRIQRVCGEEDSMSKVDLGRSPPIGTFANLHLSDNLLDKLEDDHKCTQQAHLKETKSQVNKVLTCLNVCFFLVVGTASFVATRSGQGLQQEKSSMKCQYWLRCECFNTASVNDVLRSLITSFKMWCYLDIER